MALIRELIKKEIKAYQKLFAELEVISKIA
jgi:hypothetical protein